MTDPDYRVPELERRINRLALAVALVGASTSLNALLIIWNLLR